MMAGSLHVGVGGSYLPVGVGPIPSVQVAQDDIDWPAQGFGARVLRDPGTGTLSVADMLVANAGSDTGFRPTFVSMLASSRITLAWWCRVPDNIDTSQAVTATVLHFLGTAPLSGDKVVMQFTARSVGDNENMNSGGATSGIISVTKDITGYGLNDLVTHGMGTVYAASTLTRGEYMKGSIIRDGGVGDDNYGSSVAPVALTFFGKRRRQAAP